MSYTVAICGKGGTGKTSLAALIIKYLIRKHPGESMLACDADPNANLDQALGVNAENSIVAIVDAVSKNPAQIPPGISKDKFLEYKIQEALVEAGGFDLLVMGRPEGPGCYCFVNNLLRTLIEKLSKSYKYLVIDNEAGMEHLSRRTTRKIDLLFIISDHTPVGLRSAGRIRDLVKELELDVKDIKLIINKAAQGKNLLMEEVENTAIPLAGVIPEDKKLAELSLKGESLNLLAQDSQAVQAIEKICGAFLV